MGRTARGLSYIDLLSGLRSLSLVTNKLWEFKKLFSRHDGQR